MLILNFAHPLSPDVLAEIEAAAGKTIDEVRPIKFQFDPEAPFASQVTALADQAGLLPDEWQTLSILVNPPTLSVGAVALLAELHGRMGYFPAVIRLKPMPDSMPPAFQLGELLDLQSIRTAGRTKR